MTTLSPGTSAASPTRSSVHVPGLDGIRGLAILMVACHNMQMLDGLDLQGAGFWLRHVLNYGWVGVTLFFVLSGHLITGILLDTVPRDGAKMGTFKRFFIRRALRIFPLYYGLLLVVFWLLPMLHMQPASYAQESPQQIWYWVFLSNWAEPLGVVGGALPHLWSLGVEEQFYLVLPWLVMACPRPRVVFGVALAITITCVVLRFAFWANTTEPDTVYHWTMFRMDALALGACTAALQRDELLRGWFQRQDKRLAWLILALVVGGALLTRGYPRSSMLGQTVGYSILALLFAYLVHATSSRQQSLFGARSGDNVWWMRALRWSPLRRAGAYSYGFYIIHKPLHDAFSASVFQWLSRHMGAPVAAAMLHLGLMMLVFFMLAALSHHCFEQPILRLKDRWAP